MAPKHGSAQSVSFNDWIDRLRAAGFALSGRSDGAVLISKYGCGAVLRKSDTGEPGFAARPGRLVGNEITRLVDRGYQKFWQDGSRSYPALSTELKALHQFDQDLRAVMGMTSLYNQALGTVSARYVYDRVEGREGPRHHKPFE